MMAAFTQLWRSRDELSFRSIRFSNALILLIFPAIVVMGDLRLINIGQSLFGVDSFTLELICYSLAMGICAFIPRERFHVVAALAVLVELVAFALAFVVPDTLLLPLYLVNAFAYGFCFGYGLLCFFFALNNAERLLDLLLIVLYYIVCVEWLWRYELARMIFIRFLPFVPALFLGIAFLWLKKKRALGDDDKGTDGKGRGDFLATVSSGKPNTTPALVQVGSKGIAAVLAIYIIYTVIERLYSYVAFGTGFVLGNAMIVGGFVAIALCIVIQFVLNRSVWTPWNVFLICALLSTGLLAINNPVAAGAGSLIYGVTQNLGYIAAFYLLGGAVALSGTLRYFRLFCLAEFVLMLLVSPLLGLLFGGIGTHYNYVALGVVIALICLTSALQPVFSKYVFESDWVSELNTLDERKYPEQVGMVAAVDRVETLELTAREKQVFTLLLTGMARKQISVELKISNPTANFHINNLYRKLDVQSRAELSYRYGSFRQEER
jgi:DNA-binding CsgD family transcriptional regulator